MTCHLEEKRFALPVSSTKQLRTEGDLSNIYPRIFIMHLLNHMNIQHIRLQSGFLGADGGEVCTVYRLHFLT